MPTCCFLGMLFEINKRIFLSFISAWEMAGERASNATARRRIRFFLIRVGCFSLMDVSPVLSLSDLHPKRHCEVPCVFHFLFYADPKSLKFIFVNFKEKFIMHL